MAKNGIVGGLEDAHEDMVAWTVDMAHALEKEIGPRPFGMDAIPERTQVTHGALIWEDPAAWTVLLQSHGWQGPGSAIPKNVIEYGKRLVRLKEKYPEDFAHGMKGRQGEQLLLNSGSAGGGEGNGES